MAYVDLNPIRTSMSNTPEASEYASIQERIVPGFDLKKRWMMKLNSNDNNVSI